MSTSTDITTSETFVESQIAKDFVEKIFNLKIALSQNLLGCDAKWSLFVSAALSYRYDSQLKPFPPRFIRGNGNGYNIDGLINVIHRTPTLNVILDNIVEENYDELDTEVIDLLHWVLISEKDSTLRSLNESEFDTVLMKISQSQCVSAKPTHIFEVCPSSNSKAEEIFQKQKEDFQTHFAFHGSKLDSFYSILNHGLHQHMCKNGLFGEGIYLSSELSVSLNFSPNGVGWGGSLCGARISCVAICEYINNPHHVQSHTENDKKNKTPKKYIVITNNEVVRVRYLIFYGSRIRNNSPKSLAIAWINKNKYFLTVCCYTLFLASIGIANSGNGSYLRHIINKKSSDIFSMFRKFFSDDT